MTDHHDPHGVNSIRPGPLANPVQGRVVWAPAWSLWNGAMLAATLLLAPFLVSWGALLVFFGLTGATLLLGHSIGFHRRLIHRSFGCPRWLERVLAVFGTLVGMAGPLAMMRTHDLRDWAQRQADCHDYLSHRQPMLIDAWWQLHCRLVLDHPPEFAPGDAGDDPVMQWLDRYWMALQLPLAALLFAAGGWGWLVWGVAARVCVSVTGHWFVGHLAHRLGPQSWLVAGAGVQAHDVPWAAIPTMGEAWHNNHHAFPGSARLGLYPGQSDWGFAVIQLWQRLGLAWDVQVPETLPARHLLQPAAAADAVVPAAWQGA